MENILLDRTLMTSVNLKDLMCNIIICEVVFLGVVLQEQQLKTQLKIPRFSHLLPNEFVLKYKNPFIHGTLFVEKDVITEIGGYSEQFKYAQDYKLFSDMISKNYKVKF